MSKMLPLLCAGIACLSLTGCSLQEGNSEYPGEQCYLNKDNVTKFSCMGNDYTILEDTVSDNGLGAWVGYVRQLVAVDETGKVILKRILRMVPCRLWRRYRIWWIKPLVSPMFFHS